MERLLMLRLEAAACGAEAHVNGVPVLACAEPGGRAAASVHEYTASGDNRLALVVAPAGVAAAPAPRVATGRERARLDLALLRPGQAVTDANVRLLASKAWTPSEGEAFEAPLELALDVTLPVSFPRWRWLDAPPVPEQPATERLALDFVQRLAADFTRGDPERYLAAARLRFEELGAAYQCGAEALVQRFRDHLQGLYAAKALGMIPPVAGEFRLRRIAGGRLVECLHASGEPALRTAPGADGSTSAWPLRLAMVDNRIYVLR